MLKGRFSFTAVFLAFTAGCALTFTVYSIPNEEAGPQGNPFAVALPSPSSSPLLSSSAAASPLPSLAPFVIPRSVLVNDTNEAEIMKQVDLSNTAWVTMATSDESAVLALTLFQSLRDVGTRVPHLVLMAVRGGRGSKHCDDSDWRKKHNRWDNTTGMEIPCGSLQAIAEEIVNEELLARFKLLGVEVLVMDGVPRSKYTENIAGGSVFFWGAAYSKFLAFNLTQYRKLVWLDADVFWLKNADWWLALPPLSGTMTMACGNTLSPNYAGGGGFVIEPSSEIYKSLIDFAATPNPNSQDGSGDWSWGDMEVIRSWAGIPPPPRSEEPFFPAINDRRHGISPGLQYFPYFSNMTQRGEFNEFLAVRNQMKRPTDEGMLPGMEEKVLSVDPLTNVSSFVDSPQKGIPLSKRVPPVWTAIDIRFDYCVGSMHALPYFHEPEVLYSVHMSCLQHTPKPSQYYEKSERAMFNHLYSFVDGYTRYWVQRWYETFKRAYGGRFPEPHWKSGPIPGVDAEHDEKVVKVNRAANPNVLRRALSGAEVDDGEEEKAVLAALRRLSPEERLRAQRQGFLNDQHHLLPFL